MCSLYLNFLLIAKGVPQKIVADQGTENVNIAGPQIFLGRNHSDSLSEYSVWKINNKSENRIILISVTSLMYRLEDSFFQGEFVH